MDITRVRQLLDQIPSRSDYEFRNFELETQGSWPRQVRYVLRQKEELTDAVARLEAEIELADHLAAQDKDKTTKQLKQRIATAENAARSRQRSDLLQQLAQLDAWLGTFDDSEFQDVIAGFEQAEGDSWSEQLGRQIGVELLADKQANTSSLFKASLLPLPDYKKSVIITNQFAGFLKKTAEQAEKSVAPNRPSGMPTEATTDVVSSSTDDQAS